MQPLNTESKFGVEKICSICYQAIQFVCIYSCNHAVACSHCSLRLRLVVKDDRCVQCRIPSVFVVLTAAKNALPFEKYRTPERQKGHPTQLDASLGILFTDSKSRDDILRLIQSYCRLCDPQRRNKFSCIETLKHHLKTEHKRFFCDLCSKHEKIFLQEQKLYTTESLQQHQLCTPINRGHPKCVFCNEFCYDENERYKHFRGRHLFCELCNDCSNETVFKNLSTLILHYKMAHFPCLHPECAGTPVAFKTFEYLLSHSINYHNTPLNEEEFEKGRKRFVSTIIDSNIITNGIFIIPSFSSLIITPSEAPSERNYAEIQQANQYSTIQEFAAEPLQCTTDANQTTSKPLETTVFNSTAIQQNNDDVAVGFSLPPSARNNEITNVSCTSAHDEVTNKPLTGAIIPFPRNNCDGPPGLIRLSLVEDTSIRELQTDSLSEPRILFFNKLEHPPGLPLPINCPSTAPNPISPKHSSTIAFNFDNEANCNETLLKPMMENQQDVLPKPSIICSSYDNENGLLEPTRLEHPEDNKNQDQKPLNNQATSTSSRNITPTGADEEKTTSWVMSAGKKKKSKKKKSHES